MTIKSMTGFGRAEGSSNGFGFTVEVRSVNHRYLDVKARLPKQLSALESKLKNLIRSYAQRGRIDVQIVIDSTKNGESRPRLNLDAAASFLGFHQELVRSLDVRFQCSTADLIKAPGVIVTEIDSDELEIDSLEVVDTLKAALLKLVDMRAREGAHLRSSLETLLDQARAHRVALVELAEEQTQKHREKLKSRIVDVLGELEPAQNSRLMMEIGLIAERLDVQEELDRLAAHLEQFSAVCDSAESEAVGRRLDFLCQEIVREVNTTASKAQSLEITRITIELKALMEKVREQVQNVE